MQPNTSGYDAISGGMDVTSANSSNNRLEASPRRLAAPVARRVLTAGLALALGAGSIFMTGCGASSTQAATTEAAATQAATTRTVKDSDGNDVEIPTEVTKVAPTIGAFAQITEMLTNGNGKMVATSTKQISDDFKAVFTDYEQTNPNGYDTGSVEDIIASGAQVVYGPKAAFSDEQIGQLGDAGIAFVNINKMGTPDQLCDCIQTIGDILGDEESERATEYVQYYKDSIKNAEDRASKVPESERANGLVMSVEGDAYMVSPGSDISSSLFTSAGLTNLAADYTADQTSGNGSMLQVSAEQIVDWNPQWIVAYSQQAADTIKADEALAGVDAVKNDHVLVCPKALYLWAVRSGEGCLMPEWLGSVVYPDQYSDFDMTSALQDFYKDWYGSDLSADDAEAILSGATNATASAPGRGGQGSGRGGQGGK